MQPSSKFRRRANVAVRRRVSRLQVENLECRTQPGSVLPLSEFSMIGQDLFDRDPLTGRPAHRKSDAGLVSDSARAAAAAAELVPVAAPQARFVPAGQDQPAAATPAEARARDLVLAAGVASAPGKGLDLSAPSVTPLKYQVQATPLPVAVPMAVQPLTGLQVQTTGSEGSPGGPDGIPLFTGYHGGAGADVGNAVTVDDAGNSFYAGYTERNGNRDILVWKVSPDGSTVLWETVIDSGAGDDEALGINTCGPAAVLCLTGYVASPTLTPGADSDLAVLRLSQEDGSIIFSIRVAGPGNDRGTDIRHNLDHSIAFVTGTVTDNQNNSLFFSGAFHTRGLQPIWANGYRLPGSTASAGDALGLIDNQDSIIVGSLHQDGAEKAFFAKIGFLGIPVYVGVMPEPGPKFGGVDTQPAGSGPGTFFHITGETPVAEPTPHTRMLIGKFLDLGTDYAPVWGFYAWTYSFSGVPGNLAGNYVRVDAAGNSYVMCELWGPAEDRETGDNDAHVFKVGPKGGTRPDFYHYGSDDFPALGNDKGLGLAMNPNVGAALVWGTGKASSGDFPVTPLAYQTLHGDGDGVGADAFSSAVDLPG